MPRGLVSLLAAGVLVESALAQPCPPQWCDFGSFHGSPAVVRALARFDDGTGEKIYAAGVFDTVGNRYAENLAVFDGRQWRPVLPGTDGEVRTLRVLDDGSGPALFVGGRFQNAGGQPAALLAKYDGWTWTPVPGLANYPGTLASWTTIYDVVTWDRGGGPELYVGGFFGLVGSTSPVSVARLTEVGFEPLGTGLTATPFQSIIGVGALRVIDLGDGPALYVGGTFATAGGVDARNIARWDGSAWSGLGPGLAESGADGYVVPTVTAILPDGDSGALLVAGDFTLNGVSGVARWDGAAWSVLPGDFAPNGAGRITVIENGPDAGLYAHGRFLTLDGQPATGIARWTGSRWSNVGPAIPNQGLYDLIDVVDHRGPAILAAGRTLFDLPSTPIARRGALLGDLDCSGEVGLPDLAILLTAFGVSPEGDLNADGSTSLEDLAILLSKFGNACGA